MEKIVVDCRLFLPWLLAFWRLVNAKHLKQVRRKRLDDCFVDAVVAFNYLFFVAFFVMRHSARKARY